jgi:hypothetical protein
VRATFGDADAARRVTTLKLADAILRTALG